MDGAGNGHSGLMNLRLDTKQGSGNNVDIMISSASMQYC